jgi:hypothetical protein
LAEFGRPPRNKVPPFLLSQPSTSLQRGTIGWLIRFQVRLVREIAMSDDAESSAIPGFVLGAIAVAALAFFLFVVPNQGADRDIDVRIETPEPAAPANPG